MELICGACHGRLLAESPGTTVACPHCGTFLQTPAGKIPEEAGTLFPDADRSEGHGPNPDEDTVRLNPWEVPGLDSRVTPAPESFRDAISPEATNAPVPGLSPPTLSAADSEALPFIEVSESGSVKISRAGAAAPAQEVAHIAHQTTAVAAGPDQNAAESGAALAAPVVAGEAVALSSDRVVALSGGQADSPDSRLISAAIDSPFEQGDSSIRKPPNNARSTTEETSSAGVSPVLFKFVASYASAVTVLCVYLGWQVLTSPSTLDLPDIPLKETDKKITLKYLRPDKQVPAANVLRLGESRRFGSLKVTPLRVTRGPVEFSFYDPESDETRPPEGPVLKLHLRFENVSKDQEFVPLDRRLVFTKEPDGNQYGIFKANNFVCKVEDRSRLALHVFVFDISPDSEWIMNGQNLDRVLKPGEVVETFVATTPEQIETLSGRLVWRVHFRKGYNQDSHRGVTTLIEVLFQSAEIVNEAPIPAENAEPATKDV
jgi:hypothetical protein